MYIENHVLPVLTLSDRGTFSLITKLYEKVFKSLQDRDSKIISLSSPSSARSAATSEEKLRNVNSILRGKKQLNRQTKEINAHRETLHDVQTEKKKLAVLTNHQHHEDSNIFWSTFRSLVNSNFDVAMGAFDGAEVAELVGLMLLSELKHKVPEVDFGLYRDDGLGVMNRTNGPQVERTKKKIIKVFKENGLKITIQMKLHRVDYLDTTMDLMDETYAPYRKLGDNIKYINKQSNHPPHVKKELPKMIEKRISSLSKIKEIFERSAKEYKETLNRCGYKNNMQYKKDNVGKTIEDKKNKKKRKRKVTWYNPPYNEQVETDIERQFLKLIDKHFGRTRKDKLNKIINRKTVKASYSCTPNFGSLIKQHNNRILEKKVDKEREKEEKKCNCTKKEKDKCPLKGECVIESVVYQAKLKSEEEEWIYIGSTEGSFKQRFYGHRCDMKNKENGNSTTLSKYVWERQEKGKNVEIEWKILKKCRKYRSGSRKCNVCLSEKLEILKAARKGEKMLNKRNELMYKCLHRRKYTLASAKF